MTTMRNDLINKIPPPPDVEPPMFEGLQSREIDKLAEAKAKADITIRNAPKSSKNPFFNSEYADLDVITRIVRPIYGEHGLAFTQAPWQNGEKEILITTLIHESGQWMRSAMKIEPVPNKAGEITPQTVGSAITYAKRYSLAAMANIAQTGEDDDGNLASDSIDEVAPVTPTAPTAVAAAAPVSSSTGEVVAALVPNPSPAAASPRDLMEIDIFQTLDAVSSNAELQEWSRKWGAEMSSLKEFDPPLFEKLKTLGKQKEATYG